METAQLIRAELSLRDIEAAEINRMLEFAARMTDQISPMVCMDIDDLSIGVHAQFNSAIIDAGERDGLLDLIEKHVDAPRGSRVITPYKISKFQTLLNLYLVFGFGGVVISKLKIAFWIWLAGMFILIFGEQTMSAPWHRLKYRIRKQRTRL